MGMRLFLKSALANDFKITFLCTNVRSSNENKGRLDGRMALAFVRFFSRLIWLLAKKKPRVVYYPVTATELGWIGRDAFCILLCRLFGAKVVIHLRAGHFGHNFQHFTWLGKKLTRLACRYVQTAIVQARTLRAQFDGLISTERIRVLYQAIDSGEYDNEQIDDFQVGKIVFLGHLTHAKGFCDTVRAIPLVVRKHGFAHFHFAGTMRGVERNIVFNQVTGTRLRPSDPCEVEQEILSSNWKSHYHNLGVVDGSSKMELLRSADVVVLPSYSEGFSRSLVEAMSVGKPIVFTPVGAHGEIFDQRMGVCVQPGDVEELAAAIERLLTDRRARMEIAHHNYRFVRKTFDINIVSAQLGEILTGAAS